MSSPYPPIQTGRPPRPPAARSAALGSSQDGAGESPSQAYPTPQYFGPENGSPRLYGSPKAGTQAQPRRPMGAGAGAGRSAFGGGARERITWGERKPLRHDASWFAILVALFYAATLVYYLYVRIAFTLNMPYKWYSIIILVVEILGMTAVVPLALLNCVHTHPTGSPGLPADDGTLEPDKRFHVRVLVPCYKEDLSIVSATVDAALEADLPPGVARTVYLCDDGKDAAKRAWLEEKWGATGAAVYVSGRTRAKGEVNGKSANLNNCLQNVIYGDVASNPESIPLEEVIVVFDADMQAKILEVMTDDNCALCLTPQAFSNVNPATDIFNNTNHQFWEYILPGCDAWGYLACTGTNFCLRARALASVGWFPTYCITEDYALSMELKAAGYQGRYLCDYLAVGEAPEAMRNVFRQRSRWTKGHMQVFFSMRNPLFRWKLKLVHKWLYTNGTWSYFCTVLTTWTYLLVPFLSLMFDLQPVKFGHTFALAAALYLAANYLVQSYFHVADHLRGLWMASVSNYLLSFTYFKATLNTLLSKVHIKKKAGFKPTEKTQGVNPSLTIQTALMTRLTLLTRRFNAAQLPQLYEPHTVPAGPQRKEDDCIPDKLVMWCALNICISTLVLGLRQVFVAKTLTAWIALPCLWAIYNAVPPVLFFSYVLGSTKFLQIMCFWMQLVSTLSGLGAIVSLFFIHT